MAVAKGPGEAESESPWMDGAQALVVFAWFGPGTRKRETQSHCWTPDPQVITSYVDGPGRPTQIGGYMLFCMEEGT
jgi:hypothetical protein